MSDVVFQVFNSSSGCQNLPWKLRYLVGGLMCPAVVCYCQNDCWYLSQIFYSGLKVIDAADTRPCQRAEAWQSVHDGVLM